MERAETARIRGDLSGMEAVLAELEVALEAPDANRAALHYDATYVLWRCIQKLHDVDKPSNQEQKYPERARAHVDALLGLRPDSLEAKILDGAITGVEADRSLFSRMRIGRVSYTMTRDNAKRDPSNPRAQLQWGIILFYTPGWYGGGSKPAIKQFELARAEFERQPPDPSWPNWGARETLAWLGLALARDGRPLAARASYQRVLEREPQFDWVRNKLLPDLGLER